MSRTIYKVGEKIRTRISIHQADPDYDHTDGLITRLIAPQTYHRTRREPIYEVTFLDGNKWYYLANELKEGWDW